MAAAEPCGAIVAHTWRKTRASCCTKRPGGYRIDHSIVDLNRAGTPLLEIVTEPDLSSPERWRLRTGAAEARAVPRRQRRADADGPHALRAEHQRAHHRCSGQVHKTAITEIKNLNSFSVLERATRMRFSGRFTQWIDTGSLGKKATYGWDEARRGTFLQREKEEGARLSVFPGSGSGAGGSG
jgi:aspartyl-tRNA(Asn)/glutamyl-tRNA(Gln) amidotransferase subunit B